MSKMMRVEMAIQKYDLRFIFVLDTGAAPYQDDQSGHLTDLD